MSAVSSSSYMSDAAILAWVAEQQNRLYGDLHTAMSFEEARADMASDVTDLKVLLQQSVEDKSKLAQLGLALDHFSAKYGNVPEFAEVKEVVDDIQQNLAGGIAKVQRGQTLQAVATGGLASVTQNWSPGAYSVGGPGTSAPASSGTAASSATTGRGGGIVAAPTPAVSTPNYSSFFSDPLNFVLVDKDKVDQWVKALGEKIDASNQNQQIGMIHIGEIKSTIDQGSNLASQLVKSGNDTTSSIINNF